MVRSGQSRQQQDALSPKMQALLDSMAQSKERTAALLAKAKADGQPTIDQIAKRLADSGMPAEAIKKFKAACEKYEIVRSGDHQSRREPKSTFNHREIRRLNTLGLHDGAIAHELSLSRSHVCKVRSAHGIPAVKRKP